MRKLQDRHSKNWKPLWLLFLCLCLTFLGLGVLAWQSPQGPWASKIRHFAGIKRLSSSRLFGTVNGDSTAYCRYSISYSPNFHRHIVHCEYRDGTNTTKTVVKSYLWLDEALNAYPNAALDAMDPPPPPSMQGQGEDMAILSKVVAGAGMNETSVYYRDDHEMLSHETRRKTAALNPNNGGSYLLR